MPNSKSSLSDMAKKLLEPQSEVLTHAAEEATERANKPKSEAVDSKPTVDAFSPSILKDAQAAAGEMPDMPDFLKRVERPETLKARRERIVAKANERVIKNPPSKSSKPQPAAKAAHEETEVMATSKTTKSAARTSVKGKTTNHATKTASRPAPKGDRSRFSWKEAETEAHKGVLPHAPDFSANTHRYYREPLAEAVKMAKAGDIKGLTALKFSRDDGSPGMIRRYRDLCVIALKARESMAKAKNKKVA